MKKQIIIIGASEDYSNFFFKLSNDDDMSFTPWAFDLEVIDGSCIYAKCLEFITNNIFYNQQSANIEHLSYVGSKHTRDSVLDIFVYQSDLFMKNVKCDFLTYDDKTLDYDFNVINSWIIAYIYNKFSRNEISYYF
jgi:hypothetical protein